MYVLLTTSELAAWPRLEELLRHLGLSTSRATCQADLQRVIAEQAPAVALIDRHSKEWAIPQLADHPSGHPPVVYVGDFIEEEVLGEQARIPVDAAAEEVALALMSLALEGAQQPRGPDSFIAWSTASMARLDELLTHEFASMLGLAVRAESASPELPLALVAEIHLALPDHHAEVVLGLGFDTDSASALSRLLFGEELGLDMMRDAVQEFANTAGGAVKRAANRDGVTFSLGLPTPQAAHIQSAAYGRRLVSDSFCLSVWAHTMRITSASRRATDLQEGSVLAQPVLGVDGSVLAPAGAVLTEATVQRICRELSPQHLVIVSRAA